MDSQRALSVRSRTIDSFIPLFHSPICDHQGKVPKQPLENRILSFETFDDGSTASSGHCSTCSGVSAENDRHSNAHVESVGVVKSRSSQSQVHAGGRFAQHHQIKNPMTESACKALLTVPRRRRGKTRRLLPLDNLGGDGRHVSQLHCTLARVCRSLYSVAVPCHIIPALEGLNPK
ncbi:hypothetical protein HRR83_002540 [Exophiala dermatitidis]|uniref:Uncharacterized protein n=2 Tax=Exophiala dermatitidis TaxID=5970 RepID=H6BZI0_EXODN|nr:uncharacterized protein HMPREF1120_05094 [Exophiala dermatitidis NIH/UT8656]KAJ4514453.1 hypothetical protein HRR73_005481 [Exophiala dermatitidis]EHY57043.1 hypothetical protein HMPREF1120_05094 [Exophiala dermatitidis NIH/UT8656]KAJ4523780.1 hypothetical protein HRR74_001973 [Exophiala dermatitidis]KAJ4537281.1 hypothetical protein HRR76_005294 [Exophiala dermatitidis]KAJ4555121.1 hypothetical protein HRR77_001063 [Exophiala dermatitidis]